MGGRSANKAADEVVVVVAEPFEARPAARHGTYVVAFWRSIRHGTTASIRLSYVRHARDKRRDLSIRRCGTCGMSPIAGRPAPLEAWSTASCAGWRVVADPPDTADTTRTSEWSDHADPRGPDGVLMSRARAGT